MNKLLNSTIGQLRILAFLEGTSFLLLLFICMPLKYMYDMPSPVRYVGMFHGALFIGYCAWLLMVHQQYKWGIKNSAFALLASILPFGTFVADVKIFSKLTK